MIEKPHLTDDRPTIAPLIKKRKRKNGHGNLYSLHPKMFDAVDFF